MKVKVTLKNGTSITGRMKGDVVDCLDPKDVLPWIMNDDRKFVPFNLPNGVEVQLNKSAVAFIAKEI